MSKRHAEILAAIEAAGLTKHLLSFSYGRDKLMGIMALAAIEQLRQDPRFVEGPLHLLHHVGEDPTEFRSHRGELVRKSLQVVVDKKTGRFEADLDKFSPYSDLVSWFGHAGEVIGGLFRKDPSESE